MTTGKLGVWGSTFARGASFGAAGRTACLAEAPVKARRRIVPEHIDVKERLSSTTEYLQLIVI
jgi:hypothetical protein